MRCGRTKWEQRVQDRVREVKEQTDDRDKELCEWAEKSVALSHRIRCRDRGRQGEREGNGDKEVATVSIHCHVEEDKRMARSSGLVHHMAAVGGRNKQKTSKTRG